MPAPAARSRRFETTFVLSSTEAAVVTATVALADYFERFVSVAGRGSGKEVWNWVANDLLGLSPDGETIPLSVERANEAVQLVKAGKLSRQSGRKLLEAMVQSPAESAPTIAERLGLLQVSDTGAIAGWVRETLAAHPAEVARYQAGEAKLMGFFTGQVMRLSKGKADPKAVNAALAEALQRA
jgi:aspartyl-tRNA(Asn)/glutamyl-tRNA(Gln) amidotransferase subunit B